MAVLIATLCLFGSLSGVIQNVNASSSSHRVPLDPQVLHALNSLNLSQYTPAFEALGEKVGPITMSDVSMMQSHDLLDMGIDKVSDRLLLLREAKQISNGGAKYAEIVQPAQNVIQDFMFQIHNYSSSRQEGKLLNFIVKYRYSADANLPNGYIEYKDLREIVLYYAEPTPDLPMSVYWEAVNLAMVKNLSQKYFPKMIGLSSQIQVQSSVATIVEPGNHGSTVSMGDIEPLTLSLSKVF